MLTTMDEMGADLAAMEELKLIHIAIASVPHKNLRHLEVALTNYPVIVHRCYLAKETDFMCFAMPSKHREDVERILKTHHSEIFQIPEDLPHDVTLAQKEVNKQLKETAQKEKQILSELKKLGRENHHKLASWKETTENILALLQAERKILQSGRLATVKGFVPTKKVPCANRKGQRCLEWESFGVGKRGHLRTHLRWLSITASLSPLRKSPNSMGYHTTTNWTLHPLLPSLFR